jgi:hypothetical protein
MKAISLIFFENYLQRFGSAEGKTSKELLISAKKAKRRYADYTPPGAESVAQVKLLYLLCH